MPDYLRAFEFGCKTLRSIWRGTGAPTLPGPLDDGDLLAQAEEERDVWEPRTEKCVDCGEDFEVGHFPGHSLHCKGPWWSRCAVEAKAAKTEQGLDMHPDAVYGREYVRQAQARERGANTSDAAGATAASDRGTPPRGVEEAPRGADSPIFEWSERGFRHYKPVITAYGHTVKVYDSSAASAPHVWLAVETEGAQTTSPNAHCTVEQATVIRDQLTHFIENAES